MLTHVPINMGQSIEFLLLVQLRAEINPIQRVIGIAEFNTQWKEYKIRLCRLLTQYTLAHTDDGLCVTE